MADQPHPPRIDARLARRLQLALTAAGEEFFQLLFDPDMQVLEALLKNRAIAENHLLALLKRRDLSEEFLKSVSRLDILRRSHRLRYALAKHPVTPGAVLLPLLPHLHLFELVALCTLPGVTPDQKFAAERALLQRLPTTELGNKMTLARRAPAAVVAALLKEGDARLVGICLDSPRLREVALHQFINSARTTAETISMIARHPKWKSRPRLRQAILKNPKTPGIWYTLFLPQMRSAEIRDLLHSRRLNAAQRKLVKEALERRGAG